MVLSAEAKNIISTKKKRVEVMACAGSGKTTTLIELCASRIKSGIDPKQILVLSFTTTSTNEFRDRLSTVDPDHLISVQTFHALALSIIRKNLSVLGLDSSPKILEGAAVNAVLATAISKVLSKYRAQRKAVSKNKNKKRLRMKDQIDWLQQQAAAPGKLSKALSFSLASTRALTDLSHLPAEYKWLAGHVDAALEVRREFRRLCSKRRVLAFDDCLRLAIRLLKSRAADDDGPQKLRGLRFRQLVVDEFQDTSPLQARFVAELTRRIPRVVVAGDANQAIFGYAHGQTRPMSDVVPKTHQLPLTRSYRLPQPIADLATAILRANNGDPAVKVLPIAGKPGADRPQLIIAKSAVDEVQQVAKRIRLLLTGGTSPKDIVVLSRVGAQLEPLRRALSSNVIGSERRGTEFDLQHVLLVLRLVRLIERGVKVDARQLQTILGARVTATSLKSAVDACRLGSRSSALESRYKHCAAAYMRATAGGVRADPELRKVLTPTEN